MHKPAGKQANLSQGNRKTQSCPNNKHSPRSGDGHSAFLLMNTMRKAWYLADNGTSLKPSHVHLFWLDRGSWLLALDFAYGAWATFDAGTTRARVCRSI